VNQPINKSTIVDKHCY